MEITTLIAEILAIGAVAMIWLILFVGNFLPWRLVLQTAATMPFLHDALPILALPALALTYALGWVTNYCAEQLLKPLLRRSILHEKLKNKDAYEKARLLLFQRGSPELVREMLLVDRHIIRLARGGVLNFALLAAALAVYAIRGTEWAWPLALSCILLAALSFLQCRSRYKSHRERLERVSGFLENETAILESPIRASQS